MERLEQAGAVAASMRVSFGVAELPANIPADQAAAAREAAAAGVATAVLLDQGRRRAVVSLALPTGLLAVAAFDGTVAYARRFEQSLRPWARLDYRDIDPKTRPGIEAALANVALSSGLLNPAHVVDVLSGTLAGSVRREGDAEVEGVATTHFRANASFDKVESELDLSEVERDARRSVRSAMTIVGDVVPVEVWLDAAGLPRRISVTLTYEPVRRNKAKMTLDLVLTRAPSTTRLVLPREKDVVDVETVTELRRGLRPPSS